jgi:beta-phosphoglucomutase
MRPPTPPRIGVIFDMDGVLVDSATAHRRAWQALGAEVGVPFPDELFARTFGQRNASIIPLWLGTVEAERFATLDARKEALYRDLVRDGAVRVYADVIGVCERLRAAGAGLAIASSGPRANVDLLVEVIGLRDFLQATVAAEDVARGKPDPDAFLRAADRLGVEAAHCAVLEDSTHGIEAAKRAGMLAVAVLTSTPRQQLRSAGADIFIDEMARLDTATVTAVLRAR